jgi:hypothetical protein
MGLYDGIISGISDVADWAMKNSGNIANIVQTVASVAGMGTELDAGNGLDFATLLANFQKANDKVVKAAQNAMPATPPLSGEATMTRSLISGLWTNPSPLSDGTPSQTMYNDIASFLLSAGIPAYYEMAAAGNTVQMNDTAWDIGLAILANYPVPPPPSTSNNFIDGAGQIVSTPFTFLNKDLTMAITGAYAAYAIDLGKAATDPVWHGALQINTFSVDGVIEAYRAELKSLAVYNDLVDPGSDVWLVTINVVWASVPVALQLTPVFIALWKNEANYTLTWSTNTGTVQIIKVQAPPNISPAQVRSLGASLQAQAINLGPSSNGTSKPLRRAKDSDVPFSTEQPVQIYAVTVTDCTLVPSASLHSKY